MKENKRSRNAIETFFFHCERIYTVKEKKQRMAAFYLLTSITRLVLRELTAFSLSLFIAKFYSFKN